MLCAAAMRNPIRMRIGRFLRIVGNVVSVVVVVSVGRTNWHKWHKWQQRQNGNFVPKALHVSRVVPQMLQLQIGEKLQMRRQTLK